MNIPALALSLSMSQHEKEQGYMPAGQPVFD